MVGVQALTLQPPDHAAPHLGDVVGILAVVLLHPRPTGITRQIQIRPESDGDSLTPHLQRHGSSRTLVERGVPSAPHADLRREHRRTDALETVVALLHDEGRYPEPSMLQQVSLQRVHRLRALPPVEAPLKGHTGEPIGAKKGVQGAEAGLSDCAFERIGDVHRSAGLFVVEHRPITTGLSDLLLHGHPAE